ncbi:MAG: hypothetical protein IPH04_20985 [Saprospirales bacterium]|jgi:uncharacterized membrane protein|nr:hypothetical protein [Saprospirales bacterium]MBK7335135.1 hypothetical protein [Saprospirales bacterium]
MGRTLSAFAIGGFFLLQIISAPSCKHFPLEDIIPDPGDTIVIVPPPPDDTLGTPCDPNLIYFTQQILPILQSNCAMSGCHDAASAQDGVVLTSYESVMNTAEVVPFNPGESELYDVLVEDDFEDRMPQPPVAPLSAEQIGLISAWIQQGAKNLSCDPDSGGCDTNNVGFAAYVFPVIQSYCLGCHSGGSPSGGINLNSYAGVQAVAQNGQLYGAISHAQSYSAMPQNGAKLSDCRISKIKSWIDAGALNN